MHDMESIANSKYTNEIIKSRKIRKGQIKYQKVLKRYILEGFYIKDNK
jgi:hypothetical protein